MRGTATIKKIRLNELASALDLSPRLLRSWTEGGKFHLLAVSDREPNKWRDFSEFDVAHLAIGAQLIRYGFGIEVAAALAGGALTRVVESMGGAAFLAAIGGGQLAAVCVDRNLYVARHAGGELRAFLTPDDPAPDYDAALHIKLGQCIGRAFNRLREFGYDAFDPVAAADTREEEVA